jgi:hypothetical protein
MNRVQLDVGSIHLDDLKPIDNRNGLMYYEIDYTKVHERELQELRERIKRNKGE